MPQGNCGGKFVWAIRSVAARASWVYKAATAEIHAVFTNPEPVKIGSISEVWENPLTKREQEILALFSEEKQSGSCTNILQ